jgi:hypothetical protein
MASYPKWLYHPTKEALVVPDEAARKALGAGWYESPADFPKTTAPPSAPQPKK